MDKIQLETAEDSYLKQDYDAAANVYETLLKKEPENPYLLNNYASTLYQKKDYGRALAKYFKAKSIVPRDKEINENIKIAIQEINATKLKDIYPNLYFNFSESLVLLIAFNILFLIFRKSKFLALKYFCLSLLIFSSINAFYTAYLIYAKKFAFVTVNNTETYAGDDSNYPQMFELFKAQPVEILEEHEEWAKIRYDGQLAWLQISKLAKVL